LILSFGFAYSNAIFLSNSTCDNFVVMLYGDDFYGQITIPAYSSVYFSDPFDFITDPATTNTLTGGATTIADFEGLRGWTQRPQANAFYVNNFTTGYSSLPFGWMLPCSGLPFNASWTNGPTVIVTITP